MNRETMQSRDQTREFAEPQGSDLAWLAERYVLGALSPEECDAFERRLADDQAAREAVAAATALLSQVYAASQEIAATEEPVRLVEKRIGRGSAVSYAASAAVLLLAAVGVWRMGTPIAPSAESLAGVWSATHEAAEDEFEEEMLVFQDASSLGVEEIEAPDWLITAVSLGQQDSGEEEAPPNMGEGA